MLVVGITGSIGAGKTTLASMLKEKGAEVLDADLIAHEAMELQSPAWQEVVDEFGESVLGKNKEIDRKKLAEIVFANSEKLEALNRIVHPRVIERVNSKLKELRKEKPNTIAVIDAPLLIEAGMKEMLDLLVVVVTKEELRLARAAGLGLTAVEMRNRNEKQMPQEEKARYADYIIENEGGLEELRRKADDLWEVLRKKLGEKRE